MDWHVPHIEATKNTNKLPLKIPKEKGMFGRLRHIWEDNTETNI
jgi:hypothetical protein